MSTSDRDMIPYAPTVIKLLDSALGVMNEAIKITTKDGPASGMEFIADYLNDTDGIDDDLVDETPEDWLTKWKVSQ